MESQGETQTLKEGIEFITDLYNNYQGMAYGIIHEVLGQQIGPEDKADLVQESFAQFLGHMGTLQGSSKDRYYRYLRATIYHVAISEGRRLSRGKLLSLSDVLEEELQKATWHSEQREAPVLEQVENRQKRFVLYRALERLSQLDRDLILAFYLYALKDKEAASYLGVPYMFVRIYRKRALKRLSKEFVAVLEQDRREGRGFF